MLLFNFCQRLFEDIQGDRRLVFIHNKRRAEPQRRFATAEHHQALFKGQHFNAVAQLGRRLARRFVLYKLNADHQPASAHVAHHGMSVRPGPQPLQHQLAHAGGVVDSFPLEDVHGGLRCSQTQRIAAESGSMRARHPIHDFRLRHADAERHA